MPMGSGCSSSGGREGVRSAFPAAVQPELHQQLSGIKGLPGGEMQPPKTSHVQIDHV